MEDWGKINFIGVWSRDYSPRRTRSANAFKLWDAMLNAGHRIAATSGRDWHKLDESPVSYGITYLGLRDDEHNEEGALHALRLGRICVTAGPLLTAYVREGPKRVHPGAQSTAGTHKLVVTLDTNQNNGLWKHFDITPRMWRVINNGTCVHEQAVAGDFTEELTLALDAGWVRVELFGDYLGEVDMRIAFTNPMYVTEIE